MLKNLTAEDVEPEVFCPFPAAKYAKNWGSICNHYEICTAFSGTKMKLAERKCPCTQIKQKNIQRFIDKTDKRTKWAEIKASSKAWDFARIKVKWLAHNYHQQIQNGRIIIWRQL